MKQLTEGLRTRFGHAETNPLYAHATFLDPRFKKASLMRAYMHRTWSLPTTACYSRWERREMQAPSRHSNASSTRPLPAPSPTPPSHSTPRSGFDFEARAVVRDGRIAAGPCGPAVARDPCRARSILNHPPPVLSSRAIWNCYENNSFWV